MNEEIKNFRVFTVGWGKKLIKELLIPISENLEINFVHGIVGGYQHILNLQKDLSACTFTFLGKLKNENLPAPDYELLSSLEGFSNLTIRSMIQGDRVLRNRTEYQALGYATLMAIHLQTNFNKYKPDLILASFDSLHSAMSLAVAKSLDIPWVAMSFPVIPNNLTGFCSRLTPETLLPITREINDEIKEQAVSIIQKVRSGKNHVIAYKTPDSLFEHINKLANQGVNFFNRLTRKHEIGYDEFTWPTITERVYDITRRINNRLMLPKHKMLLAPPEENFVFFPLHMLPESTIDTWAPFYQDQIAFINQISLSIPINLKLIVKLHFSDPDNYTRNQLEELLRLPNLQIAHPGASSFTFLKGASLVFGIQGTACLEAALLGKPVLIFGDSPYQHFPCTERARCPDELHSQICRMLKRPPPTDQEIIDAFSVYISRYMPGRVNDWSRPIEENELTRLVNCFQNLKSFILK